MSTMIKDNKKKLIAGAVAGVAALALIGGGTFALWSDFDSIEGNELAAGTLTIELGQATPIEIEGLAPGENKAQEFWLASRSDDTAALQNAALTGTVVNVVGTEDGCAGNSEVVADPDCGVPSSGGEFPAQAYIQFAIKPAVSPTDCGGSNGYVANVNRQGSLAAIEDRTLALGALDPDEGVCIRVEAGLPGPGVSGGIDFTGADSTNAVQGDSATFDVRFDLTQVTG